MPRKFLATLFLACWALAAAAETPADNRRLTAIFAEDQAARQSGPIDWEQVAAQDRMHREEVPALLGAGQLRTSNDYYHAAMVLQHGDTAGDYQLAFSPSRLSAALDPSSRRAHRLPAASWGRILVAKGVPQWYGTQYRTPVPGGPTELYTIDGSVVSGAERAALGVPRCREAKDLLLQIDR